MSYPGAHAVISAAGAKVLDSFFKPKEFDFNVTSEVMPGVERSFKSFSAAALRDHYSSHPRRPAFAPPLF
jgi:hypothetical protein